MTKNDTLALFGGTPTIPTSVVHPAWPVITDNYVQAIDNQLHESISIYNRSGVIEEFEEKFASIHNKRYALLNNSGTNSIWSLFVGAGLLPGDEVICPTYTFFATNTPLLSSGLVPVFCDADDSGNMDPDDLVKRITPQTKAIMVTHMWGYPAQMHKIQAIAKRHKLLLFEDCSHAHMASLDGELVGTFGDAAAWSLQGQKNITGGEGGVVVTDNQEVYIRANLLGHYNKRCKQEIPPEHPLHEFSVTGMGLKMRSHPLAVAFAYEMLDKHQEYQEMRDYCAQEYEQLFAEYDFIETLPHENTKPSWYAFILKYKPRGGITREDFMHMLHAEGLVEVDIPGSTGPNHKLPLFKKPWVLFPQFYKSGTTFNTGEDFPQAEDFYQSIIKLPTWTQETDKQLLTYYLTGLRKVLDHVNRTK